uniref:Type II toxin-antitoxin system RelE/ParE family toxin n=1 Tax=Haemonchus placei TaxID=6290 RepID=A0A0N4VV49_HAEPC
LYKENDLHREAQILLALSDRFLVLLSVKSTQCRRIVLLRISATENR